MFYNNLQPWPYPASIVFIQPKIKYHKCKPFYVQGDPLYMAVCFWYLVKRDLSSNAYTVL